jgi:hypothetical protein
MTNPNRNQETDTTAALSDNSRTPNDSTRDPEFEMPDPEQVERDREQAEKIYGTEEQTPKRDDKVA